MSLQQRKLAVIAIGGNSLIRHKNKKSVEDQYAAIEETMHHIADVIEAGWQVLITHGNGPQVGFIMLRSEIARSVAGMHIVPLVSCLADTQGIIGYQIQQALDNELRCRGLPGRTVSLVTRVRVDPADPGFVDPEMFVGEFYTEDQLPELRNQHPDWILKKDANRGRRRVVPSPRPVEIVEQDAIRSLLEGGFHVVAVGGGGIPVIRTPENFLLGVDAVVDKDLASSLLAHVLGAELLIISTGVEQVALNFGTPGETRIGVISADEMRLYYDQGHFPPDNMGPKVRAALEFLAHGGREAIITCPDNLRAALNGAEGTRIMPEGILGK